MKKALLIVLAAAVFIAGCKKDHNTTLSTSSNSYMPVSTGTTWTYAVEGITGTDTTTGRVTGSTTINGKPYYIVAGTSKQSGSNISYIYEANHIIATRGSNAAAGITVEIQLLNDTVAVGHSWTARVTDNGLVNGLPGRIVNTIKEKGISKVVAGKTFTDVIHVEIHLQYDFGSGFEDFATYNYYLAKGIGIVYDDAYFSGVPAGTQTLINYTIK